MSAHAQSPNAGDTILRTELKVVGMLFVVLVAVECAITGMEGWLSVDIQHLRDFANITSQLRYRSESLAIAEQRRSGATAIEAVSNAPVQILMLGNSMTRHGIDDDAFRRAIQDRSLPVELLKLFPDNTRISEWAYLYSNFVVDRGKAPDMLLIGFGDQQLTDGPSSVPQRLARFYGCGSDDLRTLARFDLHGVEDWSQFAAARLFATCANRDRVQRRILGSLIPGYQLASNELNVRTKASKQGRDTAAGEAPQPTYERLSQLIDQAQRAHVEVVLIAMPLQQEYELDPQLVELARARQFTLMDCRHPAGVTPEMLPDGLHLTQQGAALYSQYLAHWLPLGPLVEHHDRKLVPSRFTPETRYASGDQSAVR